MGEIFSASPSDSVSREIHVFVAGTASLEVVDLVCNNEVIYGWHPGGFDASLSWCDKRPLDKAMYYYARVVQADGEMAWSSPVWIDLPKRQ
jgi:hypothetical protein